MLIGAWDISKANAKQWSVKVNHCSFKNSSEWPRGHPTPYLAGNDIGFKTVTVVLMIHGDGYEDIVNNRSIILSHLLTPVELTLEKYEHKFYGVLTKATPDETVKKRWHKLTLEFNCYEFGNEVTQAFSGSTEFIVANSGDIATPMVIEVTPTVGAASIVVTGICRDYDTQEDLPVTIRELVTGEKVIIDGESGRITRNGELMAGDIDIWELPVLLPGNNKITVNNNRMDTTVRFRPRFM